MVLCDAALAATHRQEPLKAPFPWFGGKSRAAPLVWAALGNVDLYIEPFAGSLAVLLARPHRPRYETVNDIDGYIVNFWRAVRRDPHGVARYANGPINECDLVARHIWLVTTGRERLARIMGDPDYYDVQVAGWWVWGISSWFGGSWCSGDGPWRAEGGKLVRSDKPTAENVESEVGVIRRRPHITSKQGIHQVSLHVSAVGRGTDTGYDELCRYFDRLAERLRYVAVCCGDWSRVVTPGALSRGRTVGIFLDPPYDTGLRHPALYNTDRELGAISRDVREWCIANQDNPRYRIVLAGYEGEHDLPGWRVVAWTAGRVYGRRGQDTPNSQNRYRERLWLSPNCLGAQDAVYRPSGLFDL